MYAVIGTWTVWIASVWSRLKAGTKLEAPAHLPHPEDEGFSPESIATPEGQCADWVLSYDDGSRIHIHELCDGRRVVHRDQYDPNQGLGNLIAHLAFETPLVPAVLIGVGLVAVVKSARA